LPARADTNPVSSVFRPKRTYLCSVIPSAVRTSEASSDKSRDLGFFDRAEPGSPPICRGVDTPALLCHPERCPNERSEFRQVEGPWVFWVEPSLARPPMC